VEIAHVHAMTLAGRLLLVKPEPAAATYAAHESFSPVFLPKSLGKFTVLVSALKKRANYIEPLTPAPAALDAGYSSLETRVFLAELEQLPTAFSSLQLFEAHQTPMFTQVHVIRGGFCYRK
jgi:hypothetical protein